MLHDKCASIKMEEGYMRMTIEYTGLESRSLICDEIGRVEKEMDVYPEIIHRRITNESGTFSIEFSGEEYVCQRTSGEFAEAVLKKLGIKECDYS
ncbi:MAG: hypothetical protein U9Q29_04915 [Campylobacterota bacterium]|nr:hypothetical protein [Campylobacterota bacterium]